LAENDGLRVKAKLGENVLIGLPYSVSDMLRTATTSAVYHSFPERA
jgi:hypothetical protein